MTQRDHLVVKKVGVKGPPNLCIKNWLPWDISENLLGKIWGPLTPTFFTTKWSLWVTHQVAKLLRFFSKRKDFCGVGNSFRSSMKRKWGFENILSCPFWDTGPRYPKGVPWDQILGLKNFVLWWISDVTLWHFLIYVAKNHVLAKKHVIFCFFAINKNFG